VVEQREHRLSQLHDEGDGGEQNQPHQQRGADADAPCGHLLRRRQLVGQDRDEDEIVDAEHDLEDHQRQQRHPGRRIGNPHEMRG
jgi:hypothetical protein